VIGILSIILLVLYFCTDLFKSKDKKVGVTEDKFKKVVMTERDVKDTVPTEANRETEVREFDPVQKLAAKSKVVEIFESESESDNN
jgi:hypothetical protein